MVRLQYNHSQVEQYKSIISHIVQITHNLNGPHVWHACDTRGVYHTRVGFLDSTRVDTHTQYLHMRVFLHMCMLVWLM